MYAKNMWFNFHAIITGSEMRIQCKAHVQCIESSQ